MTQHDHQLVGRLVQRESEARYPTRAALAAAIQVNHSTVYRVFKGDPRIKSATFRRIERVFGLPADSLDDVREHDTEALRRSGMRPDLLAWVLAQIDAGE